VLVPWAWVLHWYSVWIPPASRIYLDWPKDAVFACSVTAMHPTGIAQT